VDKFILSKRSGHKNIFKLVVRDAIRQDQEYQLQHGPGEDEVSVVVEEGNMPIEDGATMSMSFLIDGDAHMSLTIRDAASGTSSGAGKVLQFDKVAGL
jgi:hypothetical protein